MLERARMVSLARGAVGLGAADPGPYLALVGPDESDAMRAAMLTMSGCGLTVRGLWRRLGLADARLEAPYAPGSVMSTIQGMAQEAGAWSSGAEGLDVGDVVYLSEPDHVGTIVRCDARDAGGWDVTTVDGGSTDAAGRQVVVTWDRQIGAGGEILTGPMAGGGRRVVGCVSLPPLVARFGGAVGLPPLSWIVGGAGAALLVYRLARGRWPRWPR